MLTKRALKKLSRLERKFSGPNAGLVWGIWPLYYVEVDHPFHWCGVFHDLEYLLRDIPVLDLKDEILAREAIFGEEATTKMVLYLNDRAYVTPDGYQKKSRADVDKGLSICMLKVATYHHPELLPLRRRADIAIKLLGWWPWYF